MIKVEKRLPFGFAGFWGKVYKPFNYTEEEEKYGEVVEFDHKRYVAMTMPVQFRDAFDRSVGRTRLIKDLSAEDVEDVQETSDSYWKDGGFACVVSVGDLVRFGNDWNFVTKVVDKNIFSPAPQTIYAVVLKNIDGGLVDAKN